jgi:Dolichyl-phosphate-mannose-protein mannosyltransferase
LIDSAALPDAKPPALSSGILNSRMPQVSAPQWEAIKGGTPARLVGWLETSLGGHRRLWVWALLATGLIVRIGHARGVFLNPDEAMHFAAANQDSWWLTYKASLSLAHPPLLVFLLHLWRHLGTSELMLRLPSILAGIAFSWVAFRWALLVFHDAVAWSTFIFLLFLPSSIQLSTEIRQYAFLLAFEMATVYFLERALKKSSAACMLFSGVCLWLALLSHFSAFLFAPALGIYVIHRLWGDWPGSRVLAAWVFGEAIAVALCYFLLVTQISNLEHVYRGFTLANGFMPNGFLAKYYYIPGSMNPAAFVLARTGGFFQFAFQQLVLGDLAFILFLVGVGCVIHDRAGMRVKRIGILLMAPFVINCMAALVRVYPYGGTRHSAFLLPFAICTIAAALSWIAQERLRAVILVTAAVVILSTVFPSKQFAKAPLGAERIDNMRAAVNFVRQLPATEPIFSDVQSSLPLLHYLCERHSVAADESVAGFTSYQCGGHQVVVERGHYVFTLSSFENARQLFTKEYGLPSGTNFAVAQIGPGADLGKEMEQNGIRVQRHDFGSEISLLQLSVE